MKQKIQQIQTGRTMTEMLGVLFVIGLLSLAVLFGFTYAVDKYHANETVNEIRSRAADVIYNTLHHDKMFVGSEWKSVAHNGKPISYDLTLAQIDYEGQKRQPFSITVADISKSVCEKMLDMGFSMPYKIEVNDVVFDSDTAVCHSTDNKMQYFFVIDAATAQLTGKDDGDNCDENEDCQSALCQNGICVECKGNWDCPTNEVCDISINKCVECVSDFDCNIGTCENNVCSSCVDKGCPDGEVCNAETGKCVVCITNDDCPNAQVCDTSVPKCVDCLQDEDCEGNLLCDTQQKKCFECFTNADCPLDTKGYCETSVNTCELCKGRCLNIPLCPVMGESDPGKIKLCSSYQPTGQTINVIFHNSNGAIVRIASVSDTLLSSGLVFASIDKSATHITFVSGDMSGVIMNTLNDVINHVNNSNTLFANTMTCTFVRGTSGAGGGNGGLEELPGEIIDNDYYYFENCTMAHEDVTKASSIF